MKRSVSGIVCGLLGATLGLGCATTDAEGTPARRRRATSVQADRVETEGGGTADPSAIPPEKFVELDQFFRSKASGLQFRCYNQEVERTQKKYEGNVTLAVVVLPGGKSSEVKIIESTLRQLKGEAGSAKAIEDCLIEDLGRWEWPDVPAPAPYSGSLNFKPAW